MITPILCLVSFCLLCWVMILKMEIGELHRQLGEEAEAPEQNEVIHRKSTTKGMQSFEIG